MGFSRFTRIVDGVFAFRTEIDDWRHPAGWGWQPALRGELRFVLGAGRRVPRRECLSSGASARRRAAWACS
ncbi:MAG TPA: hypothetical protein VI248_27170, partial [Kineosporiaceae bacterium]